MTTSGVGGVGLVPSDLRSHSFAWSAKKRLPDGGGDELIAVVEEAVRSAEAGEDTKLADADSDDGPL